MFELENEPESYEKYFSSLTKGASERVQQWILERIQPGMKVLEVGCGPGALSLKMAEKKANVIAYDKNFNMKRFFIEKIDRVVFRRIVEYVDFDKTIVAVTSDHVSSVEDGEHKSGLIPFTIYTNGLEANDVIKYDEESCKIGPVIHIDEFMDELVRFIA